MKKQAGCPMCGANHPGNHGGYHSDMGKPKPPENSMFVPAPKTGRSSQSIAPGGSASDKGGMGPRGDESGYKDSTIISSHRPKLRK